MKTLKERREIEDHFDNGGDVEYMWLETSEEKASKWGKLSFIMEDYYFDWITHDYRIKQKSVFRPWIKGEFLEYVDCWFRKKNKETADLHRLTKICVDGVDAGLSCACFDSIGWLNPLQLLEDFEIYDLKTGKISPCGVEVQND